MKQRSHLRTLRYNKLGLFQYEGDSASGTQWLDDDGYMGGVLVAQFHRSLGCDPYRPVHIYLVCDLYVCSLRILFFSSIDRQKGLSLFLFTKFFFSHQFFFF